MAVAKRRYGAVRQYRSKVLTMCGSVREVHVTWVLPIDQPLARRSGGIERPHNIAAAPPWAWSEASLRR